MRGRRCRAASPCFALFRPTSPCFAVATGVIGSEDMVEALFSVAGRDSGARHWMTTQHIPGLPPAAFTHESDDPATQIEVGPTKRESATGRRKEGKTERFRWVEREEEFCNYLGRGNGVIP